MSLPPQLYGATLGRTRRRALDGHGRGGGGRAERTGGRADNGEFVLEILVAKDTNAGPRIIRQEMGVRGDAFLSPVPPSPPLLRPP